VFAIAEPRVRDRNGAGDGEHGKNRKDASPAWPMTVARLRRLHHRCGCAGCRFGFIAHDGSGRSLRKPKALSRGKRWVDEREFRRDRVIGAPFADRAWRLLSRRSR
jgi:hypothetical protein